MLNSLPTSITRAVAKGLIRHAEAQAAADRLADIMAEIHGGDWRISINHPRMVVLIWQHDGHAVDNSPVDKSNNGENCK